MTFLLTNHEKSIHLLLAMAAGACAGELAGIGWALGVNLVTAAFCLLRAVR